MVRRLFLFIVLGTLLVSCGGKKSKKLDTSATFQILVGAVSDPNLSGGVMVYGRAADGQNFAINVTSDSLSFPIPNGSWDFYAVGWDGATPLTGNIRCGDTSANLDGGDAVVSFTLSDANCANGNYGATTYKTGNQFRPLRLVHCTDITGVVNGTSDCNGLISSTMSYQISYETFGEVGGPPLEADCVDDAGNVGGNTNTTLNLPTGGFFANFLTVRIATFRQTGCAGSPSKEFFFDSGLEGGHPDSVLHPDAGHSVVFLDAPATIVVPGISNNPSSNNVREITNAGYKLKSIGVGLVIKKQDLTNAGYKIKSNRKAVVTKPKFSEATSTNYKLHVGTK